MPGKADPGGRDGAARVVTWPRGVGPTFTETFESALRCEEFARSLDRQRLSDALSDQLAPADCREAEPKVGRAGAGRPSVLTLAARRADHSIRPPKRSGRASDCSRRRRWPREPFDWPVSMTKKSTFRKIDEYVSGFIASCLAAVEEALAAEVDHAMVVRYYGTDPNEDREFSPPVVLDEEVRTIQGEPDPKSA